jgi:hypothetical protein
LLVTRKARTVDIDTKDIIWDCFIEVEERWKVMGSSNEKALVLKCIILSYLDNETRYYV